MDFVGVEETDGVRLSWNVLPPNRMWAEKLVLPIGIHYTPFKQIPDLEFLGEAPVGCSSCKSILNPYCVLDPAGKSYTCSVCGARNGLPQSKLKQLSGGELAELNQKNSTIEYLIDDQTRDRGYIFVVDKCIPEEEMVEVKAAILAAVANLSDDNHVALVSFDRNVFIQDLMESEFLSEHSINGSKDYEYEKIAKMLMFPIANAQTVNHKPGEKLNTYFCRLESCRAIFERAVEKLKIDRWPENPVERPLRAFGAALKAALTLASGWFQHGCQIICTTGGMCTYGPGQVVVPAKEVIMRSHDDLADNSERQAVFKKAKEFYDAMLPVFRRANASIALFAFSCDQFGYAEIRDLVVKTGGFAATHELFTSNVFKDSFKNFFALNEYGFIDKAFGGRLELTMTKGMKVQGAVGCCMSEGKKDPCVSDIPVGEGGTTVWYLGTFDKNSTYSIVLENDRLDDLSLVGKPFVVQLKTYFKDAYGQMKLRVSTIYRKYGDMNKDVYADSFDQEAAILLTARCALSLSGMMDQREITKWIDKRLIKLYARFGVFTKGVPTSFKIVDAFTLVPQFFYYLRKSTFILNFAVSVDEMHYNRTVLLRENVTNSLVMIQPSLLEYSCDRETPEAVLCDIGSLRDDVVILFDAYFNVVIWHGRSIKEWRDQGYHEEPDYASLKAALEMPVEDSKMLIEERFPAPRLVFCDEGHGDERILKSKLNPGDGQNYDKNATTEAGNFITDDRNLKYFTDFLLKVVVTRDV